MPITRRQFIIGSAAGLGSLSLPVLGGLFSPAEAADTASGMSYGDAFSTLSRMSFGPLIPECNTLAKSGLKHYLESQLHPVDAGDTACNTQLRNATLHIEYKENTKKPDDKKPEGKAGDEMAMQEQSYPAVNEERPLSCLNKPIEQLWPLTDNKLFMDGKERNRPAQEVRAATWIRAVHSQWQLREVMVEFWHNHFNVNAFSQSQINVSLPTYDGIMRRNCFGNFRDMLEEVAQSPAMLFYLNNAKSKASPANENYARELFELHTLGADHYYNNLYNRWREVPGATHHKPIGYIDQDVYEAARAFTGWTIEDGTNTGRGTTFPKTGKFVYFDGWHDNYQKRVLGTEFDPNTPPMADGRHVLDLVSNHPGTADFLCTKLCRRFISDNPPKELIDRAAKTWQQHTKNSDQIAQVLRVILLSPEYGRAKGTKVKRPFEFAVSFLRATGAIATPNEGLFGAVSGAGYRQFEWAAPTGHPDIAEYWLNTNTTLSCWNLLESLCSPGFKAAAIDLAQQTPASVRTTSEIVNYWYMRLTGQRPDNRTFAGLMQFMPESSNVNYAPDLHHPGFKMPLQEMVTTIAMLPDFSVRG